MRRIKEELLKEFNLHTIVRLPNGVFAPYTGIPTNLLFFDRAGPTKEIWYYDLPKRASGNYSKSRPMQFEEFHACLEWWEKKEENENAWKVSAEDCLKYDGEGSLVSVNLDRRNPRAKDDLGHIAPEELARGIAEKEEKILSIMKDIHAVLAGS